MPKTTNRIAAGIATVAIAATVGLNIDAVDQDQLQPHSWNESRIITDESITSQFHLKFANYVDENSEWKNINLDFDAGNSKYVIDEAPYKLSLPVRANKEMKFENNNKYDIKQRIIRNDEPLTKSRWFTDAQNVKGYITDEGILYPNALKKIGASLLVQSHEMGVKYLVKWSQAPPQCTDRRKKNDVFTIPFRQVFDKDIEVEAEEIEKKEEESILELKVESFKSSTGSLLTSSGSKSSGSLRSSELLEVKKAQPKVDLIEKKTKTLKGFKVRMNDFRAIETPQAHIWDSSDDFDSGYRQVVPINIRKSGKRILFAEKVIDCEFFEDVIYPVYTDDEDTFYPDASAEVTSVDGYMRQDNSSWDSAHDATTASTTVSDTSTIMDAGASLEGSTKRIMRSIAVWDASSIPSGVNLTNVTASLYVSNKWNPDADAYSYVNVFNSNPASNTAVVGADFDQVGDAIDNPTKYSDDLTISSATASAYNNWDLNATGLAYVQTAINNDGIVKLGMREGHDIEDVAPDVSNGSMNGLRFSTADVSGTSEDPKLIITYTLPKKYPQSLPSNSDIPSSAEIVSRWLLDEDSGNRDDSVGSNDLTQSNGVTGVRGFQVTATGADLESSSSQYLSIADGSHTGLDISGEMTISAWIKYETISASVQGIVYKYDSSPNQGYLMETYNGDLRLYTSSNGSAGAAIGGAHNFSVGTWYHVAATIDTSGNAELFIDGESIATSSSMNTSINNSNAPFIIGSGHAGGNPTSYNDAVIQDVIIWDDELINSEIEDLYNLYFEHDLPNEGWLYKAPLTISASDIGSTLSSFPVLLTDQNLPAEIKTYSQSNGGDIRFSSDEDGIENLPVEVVQWTIGTGKNEQVSDSDTVALWHFNGALASGDKQDNAEGTASYDIDTEGDGVTSAEGFDGEANGSYEFDGVDDHVDSATDINFTSSFTIETWINGDSFSNAPIFISSGDGSTVDWYARVGSTGYMQVGYTGGNSTDSTTVIETGEWYYLAYVHDDSANEDRFYVNGELISTHTGKSGNPSAGAGENTRIGKHPGDHGDFSEFNGKIDEIRLSDIARTDEEIAAYYQETNMEAWVEIPSVSSSTDTTFYVWYGHADSWAQHEVDRPYGTEDVWNDDFLGVWHMNQLPSSTLLDSTSYSHDGTSEGSMTDSDLITGSANTKSAIDFDGSNDAYAVSDNNDLNMSGDFTVMTITKTDTVSGNDGIASHENFGSGDGWLHRRLGNKLRLYLQDDSSGADFVDSSTTYNTSDWIISASIRSSSNIISRLGSTSVTESNSETAEINPNRDLYIGAYILGSEYFDGKIDEVRISDVARSADWLDATYDTSTDPDGFIAEGEHTPVSGGGSSILHQVIIVH